MKEKEVQRLMEDKINHPKHYNNGLAKCECGRTIECIDVTRHMGFSIGNIVKYLWRYKDKNGNEDLKKAQWYLDDLVKQMDKKVSPLIGSDNIDSHVVFSDILNITLREIGLVPRTLNCLMSNDIFTIGQLINFPRHELIKMTNFGRKSLIELQHALDKYGIKLEEES